jgi:hypothetical protein
MSNDLFNRKKTLHNDLIRFQNITTKIHKLPTSIPINNEMKKYKIEAIDVNIPFQKTNDNYDISAIHSQLNKTIEFDVLHNNKNTFNNYIHLLRSKKINTIYNVYQENYVDNVKPTGLGDFIRGCFFILQFCDLYKFHCKIIINHPIALFLENSYKTYLVNKQLNQSLFDSISMFTPNNWNKTIFNSVNQIVSHDIEPTTIDDFVKYLNCLTIHNKNLFVYNILFPYREISLKHRVIVRTLLEPNTEMKLYCQTILRGLTLSMRSYSVIHIRCGDSFLNNENKLFDTTYFNKLVLELTLLLKHDQTIIYLLIADNNEIKLLLQEIFPSFKIIFKQITHVGEGTLLDRDKVKNTLLDFYLMSYSNSIYSYTSYLHGSGFSYWCSKLYDIPCKCMYLQNDI